MHTNTTGSNPYPKPLAMTSGLLACNDFRSVVCTVPVKNSENQLQVSGPKLNLNTALRTDVILASHLSIMTRHFSKISKGRINKTSDYSFLINLFLQKRKKKGKHLLNL